MRILLEALLLGIGGLGIVGFGGYFLKAKIKPPAPKNCKHRQWTQWKIEQIQPVHIYNELDEGKALPDRVDAYMTRECLRCGAPEAKTVRGIDSPHFK